MKKNYYIVLLIAFSGFLPECIMAQTQKETNSLQLAQIKQNAAIEAKVTAALIRKKYQTDVETERSLYNMYYEQKLAVAMTITDFSNSADLETKLAAIIAKHDSISEISLKAVKTNSLYRNKVLRRDDNSRFADAIRMRKELSLNSEQMDKLFIATEKADQLGEDITFKLREFERQQLPTILSDEQYTKLLQQANHKQALGWAMGDWKEMQVRGISNGLDSNQVINEIYKYDIAKLVLQDKYGENIPPIASIKTFQTPMPETLSRLKTARRYNNPIPEKSSNVKFTW